MILEDLHMDTMRSGTRVINIVIEIEMIMINAKLMIIHLGIEEEISHIKREALADTKSKMNPWNDLIFCNRDSYRKDDKNDSRAHPHSVPNKGSHSSIRSPRRLSRSRSNEGRSYRDTERRDQYERQEKHRAHSKSDSKERSRLPSIK
jgi:hypothetical protein